jgi:flagellar assembly protein FliH
MNAPVRYLFDNRLDEEQAPPPVAHERVEAMKAAHAREIEEARRAAFDEGRAQGEREAGEKAENRLAQTLEELLTRTHEREEKLQAELAAINRQAMELAVAVAGKLAGSLLSRYPQEAVEGFFAQCLSLLPQQASLQIHLPSDLAAVMGPRLEAMLAREGRRCSLNLVADEDMENGDCRIIWRDGGIERRQSDIYQNVEQLLAACLQKKGAGGIGDKDGNNAADVRMRGNEGAVK